MEGKSRVDLRLARMALCASAVIFSYVALLIGFVAPRFFASNYSIKSLADLDLMMPPVMKLATHDAWTFALAEILICLAATMPCRFRVRVLRHFVLGLCGQALVFWVAMFCDCYDGFLGSVSMHHRQSFEFGAFLSCGFGIFPVALAAIMFPLFAALLFSNCSRALKAPQS